MMDRRRFARLIAGSLAAGRLSGKQAEGASAKTALYSGVGGDLTLSRMDVDEASLVKRNTLSLPANIQYAWPHPSRQYFYVVSSGGGPGVASNENFAHAFRIDSATAALTPHGQPQDLPSRPIHTSVDMKGEYLLTAYKDPSSLTVHNIKRDGMLRDRGNHT